MGIALMENELRRLQLTQLEILKVVNRFCLENAIPYYLCGGTLLGAVRHRGFIPWDDDLDICMPRDAYDRFISAWRENGSEGYILQNKEDTPSFTQSFTKVRKEHTTFLQEESERGRYHTGIFIDIFPIDRAPAGNVRKLFFYGQCMLYQLFTREFIPPKAGKATRLGSALLLGLVRGEKRKRAREGLLKSLKRYDNDTTFQTVLFDTVIRMKQFYPADFFDNSVMLEFEGGAYPAMPRWDEYLTTLFGDYMTLPPESERTWKHHPIILDFEHDYGELMALRDSKPFSEPGAT